MRERCVGGSVCVVRRLVVFLKKEEQGSPEQVYWGLNFGRLFYSFPSCYFYLVSPSNYSTSRCIYRLQDRLWRTQE